MLVTKEKIKQGVDKTNEYNGIIFIKSIFINNETSTIRAVVEKGFGIEKFKSIINQEGESENVSNGYMITGEKQRFEVNYSFEFEKGLPNNSDSSVDSLLDNGYNLIVNEINANPSKYFGLVSSDFNRI